jgi:hypothetical protein
MIFRRRAGSLVVRILAVRERRRRKVRAELDEVVIRLGGYEEEKESGGIVLGWSDLTL